MPSDPPLAVPLADKGREVLQQAQAPALALLRVELRGEERASPHRGGKRHPVGAGRGGQRGLARGWVVRVHEVEVRSARHAVEDREVSRVLHGVPAHVRHLEPSREAADHARQHVQPLALPELLALREEELIAEADAEERPALIESRADRLEEPSRLEVGHGVVKRTVTWQHEGAGVLDHPWILRHHRAHPEAAEGLLHAAQVAAAVVDDSDHSGSPLSCLSRLPRGLFALAGSSGRPLDTRRLTTHGLPQGLFALPGSSGRPLDTRRLTAHGLPQGLFALPGSSGRPLDTRRLTAHGLPQGLFALPGSSGRRLDASRLTERWLTTYLWWRGRRRCAD